MLKREMTGAPRLECGTILVVSSISAAPVNRAAGATPTPRNRFLPLDGRISFGGCYGRSPQIVSCPPLAASPSLRSLLSPLYGLFADESTIGAKLTILAG